MPPQNPTYYAVTRTRAQHARIPHSSNSGLLAPPYSPSLSSSSHPHTNHVRKMTPQEVEVLPAYSPESLPPLYTPRSHSPGPSKPRPRWVFGSTKTKLDLGEKVHDTHLPVYGKNDPVDGTVHFPSKMTKVTKVAVKLEATLLQMISERGLPAAHDERQLFTLSTDLYVSPSPSGSELPAETALPFSLDLPETVQIEGEHFPLPPSSKWFHPGIVAEVYYRLTLDVSRKGLGRHERVETDLLYLPKTRAVKVLPLSWGLTPNDAKREYIDMTNWATIPLKPQWPKSVPPALQNTPITAELRLPSCFFSGYPPLSFHLHLELPPNASAEAQAQLHSLELNIHLVRQVSICLSRPGRPALSGVVSTTESIVGGMCVYTSRSTPLSRDVWGKIGCSVDGQESSWNLAKLVQVMHAAKVEIRPPQEGKGKSGKGEGEGPSWMHRQRVWMSTDEWADDAPEREGPALGLYRRFVA